MTFHGLAPWFAIAAAVSFAAWAVLIAVVAARSHAGSGQPSPVSAGLELGGDSTPAVAAMLANDSEPPHAAAAATFLDLAARNILRLSQSNNEPVSVQCGPKRLPEKAPGYERLVYDLVVAHAGDGVVPCSALALGRASDAERWSEVFSSSVIDDAREHGLSRPLLSSKLKVGIAVVTAVPAAFALLAVVALMIWVPGMVGPSRHSHGGTVGFGRTGWELAGVFLAVGALALLVRGIAQLVLLMWDAFDRHVVEEVDNAAEDSPTPRVPQP